MSVDSNIAIVTAFFDIGRGGWTVEKGNPAYLYRKNEKYFQYFERMAKLENEMIIFTSSEFVDKIYQLRQGKPTQVITFDLNHKFKNTLKKIQGIQNNAEFLSKISKKQKVNPEYWSPHYVLVTNLKAYFVNEAIRRKLVGCKQVAWVDFGYCRNSAVLEGISQWRYPFSKDTINLFTLRRPYLFLKCRNPQFPYTQKQALKYIYRNKVVIIGGVIVASTDMWQQFFKMVSVAQHKLMNNSIVDDDQGVFVYCFVENKDLFNLHYLGLDKNKRRNWFGTMQRFHQ